jgi:hypothetical protein
MAEGDGICANCGAGLTGQYCSACGERKLKRNRLKLSSFINSAFEEITDVEHSKLLRTFQTLVLRPGVLTTEYLRGRRQSFVGPVKIYLTVFALSFVLYSVFKATSVYDVGTMMRVDSSGKIATEVKQLAQRTHLSEPVAIAELNTRWQRYLNLTQAVYPLGIALLLQILYYRARSYFAEHLIFALHFSSIALGVNILTWPIFAVTGIQPSAAYRVTISASLLLTFAWVLIASRQVYRVSWLNSACKAVLLEAGYLCIGMFITFLTLGFAAANLGRLR